MPGLQYCRLVFARWLGAARCSFILRIWLGYWWSWRRSMSYRLSHDLMSPVPPLTPATKSIIIVCVVAYFIDFALFHLGIKIGGEYYLNEVLGIVPIQINQRQWVW